MKRPRLFEAKTFVAFGMALALPIGAVACSNNEGGSEPTHRSSNNNTNNNGVTVSSQPNLPSTATVTQRFQAGEVGLWTRPYAIKDEDGIKASVRPYAIGPDGTIFCDPKDVNQRIDVNAESFRVDGEELVLAPEVKPDQSNLIFIKEATNISVDTADCITQGSPDDTAEVWTNNGERVALGGYLVKIVGDGQNTIGPIG